MAKVTFVLKLDRTGVPASAARMWLDTSGDDVIQVGEEITLGTIDGKLWVGTANLSGSTAEMLFLVKFIAPVGAKWSFVASVDGATLYEAADQQTVTTRETLAGRLA
jgi:hypothetical protein